MGLEKVIIKQVVQVAKDTGKLETSITSMGEKIKSQGLKVLNSTGINPLDFPFDPTALVNGKLKATDVVAIFKPQAICSIPPITERQKVKALKIVNSTLLSLNSIIDNKNKISSALQTIQTPLNTLNVTAITLDNIIGTVKGAIKVIKAIPLPTAIIPPTGGIGLPINILTILSDSLDQLDKLLTMGKGVTKLVPPLTKAVVKMIQSTINKLNGLDELIQPVVAILSLTKTLVELGGNCPNVLQGDIDIVKASINTQIRESLLTTGNNSNPLINSANEETLIIALDPRANPGLIYNGFRLTLENNPNNEFIFDSRRIKAVRDFSTTEVEYTTGPRSKILGLITLYNDPGGLARYSYSATAEVLYEEMKYKIDNYVLRLRENIPAQEEFVRFDTDTDNDPINNDTGNNDGGIIITDPIPYVINGMNVVVPLDNTGLNQTGVSEVSGTITITEPIRVIMNTTGGTTQASYTNTIITFQKGSKPLNSQLSREAFTTTGESKDSPPTDLTEMGIWNYNMKIIGFAGQIGNQSNFRIETLLEEAG